MARLIMILSVALLAAPTVGAQEAAVEGMETAGEAAEAGTTEAAAAEPATVEEASVGEASIAIAVSAPHRQEAFAAGQWLIDTVKQVVPIWKKENWADGTSQWVHPGMDEAES